MARLAPALGAAALLAVIAVGIVSSLGGSDDDGGASDMRADQDVAEEGAGGDGGGTVGGDAAEGGVLETDDSTAFSSAPPVFDAEAGRVTQSKLAKEAARSVATLAAAYDADGARDRAQEFLELLADQAGETSQEVLDCGRVVIDNRAGTALAAYGGLGMFQKREALVLGFATSSDAQALDRYSFWIFPTGNCTQPLRIEEGALGD